MCCCPDPSGADGNCDAAVTLVDAQRVLALFAQGLAGRYLHLKSIDALAGPLLERLRPDTVTTDGTSIYLPDQVAVFDTARANHGVYRIAVLHQLGFAENGTFEFSFDEARRRLPDLPTPASRSWLAPAPLERFFNAWRSPTLMRRLFMTIEDHRIDCAMPIRYPGARADLRRVLAQALRERPPIGSLAGIFARLWEGLVRYTLGAPRGELLQTLPGGALERMLDAVAAVEASGADVYDSAAAAIRCYRVLERVGLPRRGVPAIEEEPAVEDDEAAAGTDAAAGGDPGPDALAGELDEEAMAGVPVDFRGEVMPEFVQRKLAGGLAGTLNEQAMPQVPPRDDAAADDAVASDDARTPRRPAAARAPSPRGWPDEGELRSYLYDEWDYLNQTYLRGWCRVFEHKLRGDDVGFIRDVRRRHAVLAHQVKRRFGFIRPASWRRVHRVSDGEELELDGVIEAIIDRRSGQATDDRLYTRRDRALRDVAAAFLVDMSASTDFPVPDRDARAVEPAVGPPAEDLPCLYGGYGDAPDPATQTPKRRVIDVAKEALALMSDALVTLGDQHAIYGFSGDGRHKVEFHVAKDFDDRPGQRVWTSLAAIEPRRSTRMGPAIRHALTRLAHQPARLQVLIIVSDGYPEDHDYGPRRNDDEYGIQDTAQALREAERQGVETFCVTIDPAGHDYLRRMCAPDRYMVIDDVSDLPAELSKVYRALTV